MFKKAQVVMLPTNQKAKYGDLVLYGSSLFINTYGADQNHCKSHLYFLSDEKIKESEDFHWFYNLDTKVVFKSTIQHPNCKKIIATTDKSLTIPATSSGRYVYHLPQPSQSFIEKYVAEYNKGNIITEVLVEYYDGRCRKTVCDDRCSYPNCFEIGELNVNKDNTITIKKVKDSWSREEVVSLLYKHTEDMFKQKVTLDKWIEENL